MNRPGTVELEGLRLDALNEEQCVEHVVAALSAGRGGWIVTPNLDHLRRFARDASFKERYVRADLSVADGMPLVWACRLQKTPLPCRVAGSDLIWSLSRAAAGRGSKVFLLGGDPGTAEEAAVELCARFDGLRIAGTHCPAPGFERDPRAMLEIEQRLADARAEVVFVALGSPKQEILIDRLRARFPAAWWLGCGISFSFVAGRVQRAPPWLRRIGFEWLHRMAQEPGRLCRRYLFHGIPFATALMARSAWRGLFARAAPRDGAYPDASS